ncbi:MAG TPA: hypothetical protein VMX13_09825 [Sedimentisphaerales bacterium]|nr:hypothetical protein [Sedimentisphaerales bacterium]
MKKNLLMLLCLVWCLNAGCNSGRPSRSEVEREKKKAIKRTEEVMKMMQPQVDLIHKIVQEYKDIGLAAVKVSPPGAQLHIDGGEYVEGKDEIMLPVGPHRFRAVWPDGRQVTRDVYIVTALTDMEVKFDFNEGSHSMDMNWRTEKPELHKTPVILTKPD